MKIYEIGTGYTSIPAIMGAATEIVVEELTKAFKKNGHEVFIVDIKALNRLANQLPIIEVPVPGIFLGTDIQLGIAHKLKRVVYSVCLVRVLKKIIKSNEEKVVLHFHNQYNMFFFLKLTSAKIRKKCFIAYTNHSYIWHGEWSQIEGIIRKRYFQEVICMKNADRVYVLNELTQNKLINHVGIKKEKIILINNGVNTEIYTPLTQKEIDSFKTDLGIDGKMIFLQIGSVCERKNQLGAIDLLLPFLKSNPNSIFLYAGGIISDEYQQEIRKYTEANEIGGQVQYLGEIKPGKELNKYYNLAQVMIFPSKSEGFSLVIIEAMSAGIPVIINEKLQFKLSNECLKYKNKEEFRKVIIEYILDNNIQKQLSVKSRKAVLTSYSWEKVAKDYYLSWKQE